jgi:hypothetical protein
MNLRYSMVVAIGLFLGAMTPGGRADEIAPGMSGPALFAPSIDLSGDWSGRWSSGSTRHGGPMAAQFEKLDEERYRVHFRGRFLKVVPFRYSVVLRVTGYDGERVLLGGSHTLGPVVGTFRFTAWADCTQFVATYCSKGDSGRFVMSRCGGR